MRHHGPALATWNSRAAYISQNDTRAEGRVAYCQRVESGNFALGLELPWQVQRWQMLW